ncbi:unnamed protein product [Prorocentrum cordatum]|uniref:Uncharacterized protein n=1 Tax=Prorocentrum cordatum TaxID=2364126 RepID=A0ABN9SLI7_9DINO|nr:unnamed protein product [Polarella glacialis]
MQACLLAQQPSKIASAAARGASRPRLRLLGHDVEPACWSSPRRRRWACAALQKQGGRSSTAAALELNQLYIALSGRSPGGKKLWSSARVGPPGWRKADVAPYAQIGPVPPHAGGI